MVVVAISVCESVRPVPKVAEPKHQETAAVIAVSVSQSTILLRTTTYGFEHERVFIASGVVVSAEKVQLV